MKSRRSIKKPSSSGDEGPAPNRVSPAAPESSRFAVPSPISTPNSTPKAGPPGVGGKDGAKKKKIKTKDSKESESSSDEERWLEKIKDPKMMTARQRAMYDRENNSEKDLIPPEELMSLPTGYKEKEKVMTAEALERQLEKTAKRKQLADQKREKDRLRTMERLLKKQESKLNKVSKSRQVKPGTPQITYLSTADHSVIIFPPEFDLKLGVAPVKEELAPEDAKDSQIKGKLCCVCQAPKKYNCSKSNVPLCSFKCYKENMQLVAGRSVVCN